MRRTLTTAVITSASSALKRGCSRDLPRCGTPQPISDCDISRRAGDAQAAVVAPGALPLLGDIHGIVGGIVDEAGDDLALALQRDRDREHRDAVQEVGGAVERVDVPDVGLVGALDPPLSSITKP